MKKLKKVKKLKKKVYAQIFESPPQADGRSTCLHLIRGLALSGQKLPPLMCAQIFDPLMGDLKYPKIPNKGRALYSRSNIFLPTFDGNISETVHSIYLKFGVLGVANVTN